MDIARPFCQPSGPFSLATAGMNLRLPRCQCASPRGPARKPPREAAREPRRFGWVRRGFLDPVAVAIVLVTAGIALIAAAATARISTGAAAAASAGATTGTSAITAARVFTGRRRFCQNSRRNACSNGLGSHPAERVVARHPMLERQNRTQQRLFGQPKTPRCRCVRSPRTATPAGQ
jgi:hypothetical protein